MPPLLLRPAFALPVGGLLLALMTVGTMATLRRIRQDRDLRLSEQRLRTLLDNAPEAIAIFDVETNRFIEGNEKALTLFGVEHGHISEVDPASLTADRLRVDGERGLDKYVQAALRGETCTLDWAVQAGDGSEVPCELRLVRLPSLDRQLVRISVLDTRERLEAESRRVELEAQLRQSQKLEAVGKLSGGIAHDFNNLLTVIRGNLELLMEEQPPGTEDAQLVEGALDAVLRSTELSQRLLAIGRRQPLEARPVSIGDLVRSMEDLLRRSLGETIELVVSIAPGLWPATADVGQLENTILNLCINARDAMPRGGRLTLAAWNLSRDRLEGARFSDLAPGDYVGVSATDTGAGMSAEVAAQAFDPFFTTKEVGKGSGLGLSMVYGFATQSGGSARITTRLGEGSRVEVVLPRAEDVSTTMAQGSRTSARSGRGHGEHILIVEDDAGVTRMLEISLGHLGYRTSSVSTGDDAWEKLRGGQPVDAMLVDLILPGSMNGVELGRKVRASRPEIPLLFMSGYGEEALGPLFDGADERPCPLLRKPFNQADLADHLRRGLHHEAS